MPVADYDFLLRAIDRPVAWLDRVLFRKRVHATNHWRTYVAEPSRNWRSERSVARAQRAMLKRFPQDPILRQLVANHTGYVAGASRESASSEQCWRKPCTCFACPGLAMRADLRQGLGRHAALPLTSDNHLKHGFEFLMEKTSMLVKSPKITLVTENLNDDGEFLEAMIRSGDEPKLPQSGVRSH